MVNARFVGGGCIVLAVGVLGFWLVEPDRDVTSSGAVREDEIRDSADREDTSGVPGDDVGQVEEGRGASTEILGHSRVPVPSDSDDGGDPLVRGRIALFGLDGQEIPATKGYLVLTPIESGPSSPPELRATVRDGEWTCDSKGVGMARIDRCVVGFDGRSFDAEPTDPMLALSPGTNVVIEAHVVPGAVLQVVDGLGGSDLTDVRVALVRALDESCRETYQMPPAGYLGTTEIRGDSPLTLPRRRGIVTGWVRAAGYAWQRFAVDPKSTYVRIELNQGGNLQVLLPRHDPADRHEAVFVFASRGSTHAPLAIRKPGHRQSVEFAGLSATGLVVALAKNQDVAFIGPWLASHPVELRPGESMTVTLDPDDPGSRRDLCTLDIGVGVSLLEERSRGSKRICVELFGGAEAGGGTGRVIELYLGTGRQAPDGGQTFSVAGLPAGSYCVSFLPLGMERLVSLSPGDRASIDFATLPPMADVRIAFSSPLGEPIRRAAVETRPRSSRAGASWARVGMTDEDGVVRFRSPVGPLAVITESPLGGGLFEIEVAEEKNDFTIMLEPIPTFQLVVQVLQEGEPRLLPLSYWNAIAAQGIPPGSGQMSAIAAIGPQVAGLSDVMSSLGATLYFDEPGEYELVFPEFPGVPDFAPRRVVVPASGVGQCEVVW